MALLIVSKRCNHLARFSMFRLENFLNSLKRIPINLIEISLFFLFDNPLDPESAFVTAVRLGVKKRQLKSSKKSELFRERVQSDVESSRHFKINFCAFKRFSRVTRCNLQGARLSNQEPQIKSKGLFKLANVFNF